MSKEKRISPLDVIKNAPKNTLVDLPPIRTWTKDEFRSLLASDPMQWILDLMNNPAVSDGDLVRQAGGLVEEAVTALLKAFVVERSGTALFGPGTGTGTDMTGTDIKDLTRVQDFKLRTDLAFALGLISDRERRLIHLIRKIRNRLSSHDPHLHFFEHDRQVVGWCNSLIGGAPEDLPPRTRFGFGCLGALTIRERELEITRNRCIERKDSEPAPSDLGGPAATAGDQQRA